MPLGQPARQAVHLEAEDRAPVCANPDQGVLHRSLEAEHRTTNCARSSRRKDTSADVDNLHMSRKSPSDHQVIVARKKPSCGQALLCRRTHLAEQLSSCHLPKTNSAIGRAGDYELVAGRDVEIVDPGGVALQLKPHRGRDGVKPVKRETAIEAGGEQSVGLVVGELEVGHRGAVQVREVVETVEVRRFTSWRFRLEI